VAAGLSDEFFPLDPVFCKRQSYPCPRHCRLPLILEDDPLLPCHGRKIPSRKRNASFLRSPRMHLELSSPIKLHSPASFSRFLPPGRLASLSRLTVAEVPKATTRSSILGLSRCRQPIRASCCLLAMKTLETAPRRAPGMPHWT
jgi:hypothetical protein